MLTLTNKWSGEPSGARKEVLLRYDASGTLKHHGDSGPWTTSFIYIRSVELKPDRIRNQGSRAVQIFDIKKSKFQGSLVPNVRPLLAQHGIPTPLALVAVSLARSAYIRVIRGEEPLPFPRSFTFLGNDSEIISASVRGTPYRTCYPENSG